MDSSSPRTLPFFRLCSCFSGFFGKKRQVREGSFTFVLALGEKLVSVSIFFSRVWGLLLQRVAMDFPAGDRGSSCAIYA